MQIENAINIYQTQVGIVNDIWSYFATVTIAILGFTIGFEKSTRSRFEVNTIQIGYFAFGIGNLIALRNTQVELQSLASFINSMEGISVSGIKFDPFTVGEVTSFHLPVTLIVILCIEAAYRRRSNKASQHNADNRD